MASSYYACAFSFMLSSLLFNIACTFFHECHVAASSTTVLAPNMSSCHLPLHLPSAQTPYDCCAPPASYEPRLFRPNSSTSSSSLRVRCPAHAADEAYATKLARAYTLMKALPPDDPRSFYQQANIHCAYCNTVYNQINSSELFQVHGSWLFFPFHRWYIYFHERILAKLLDNDDTFALSYWNYDHPDGASIPWLFSSSSPQYTVLSDASRDSTHESPAIVALDFNVDTDLRPPEVQLRENDNTMYRALIRDASTPEDFFGWPYRQGDSPMQGYGAGSIEARPHSTVHSWVGNKSEIAWKHMGAFYASGLDPVFYAHHAEIDRFWELWKAMPNHEDIDDEDYQNAEFLFYNEEGELVRVKAGDARNATMLGYMYEEVETPWMDAIPEKRSNGPAKLGENDTVCVVGEAIALTPCSFAVERDPEVSKASPWLRDHLVLSIEYNSSMTRVDIYLNYPVANATTDSGCKEYVTDISYSHFNFAEDDAAQDETVKLDISDRLIDLDLTEESSIVVTLVPRVNVTLAGNITLISAFVEYTLPFQRWDGRVALR